MVIFLQLVLFGIWTTLVLVRPLVYAIPIYRIVLVAEFVSEVDFQVEPQFFSKVLKLALILAIGIPPFVEALFLAALTAKEVCI
jgi:hypothetical protein